MPERYPNFDIGSPLFDNFPAGEIEHPTQGVIVGKASTLPSKKLQIEFGAGFLQNEAEDAGGLMPGKDDNEVIRKSGPKANAIF